MNISFQCPANTAFAIKYERQQSKKQQLDKTLLSTKRQAPALKKTKFETTIHKKKSKEKTGHHTRVILHHVCKSHHIIGSINTARLRLKLLRYIT